MAFPETALDLRIEFAFGANGNGDLESFTWTDVTDDFDLAQQIQISRGRADETQHVQPTSVSFELDNASGDYTPTDPRSAHWPHVKRGVPCRISLVVASEPHVRFTGMVDSWAPDWPFGDRQASTGITEARVVVTANGVLHRLSQGAGAKTLESALTRFLTAKAAEPNTSLIAWWPLEDEGPTTFTRRVIGVRAGSSFALSPMAGVQPMHLGGEVNFAADTDYPATARSIQVNREDPFGWNARVPRRTSSRYLTSLFVQIHTTDRDEVLGQTPLMYVETSGTASFWVTIDSQLVRVRARNRNTGAIIVNTDAIDTTDEWYGRPVLVSLRLTQSGSTIQWTVRGTSPLDDRILGTFLGTVSGTVGRVAGVHNLGHVRCEEPISFSHLVVSTEANTNFFGAASSAFYNETAAHRIHRLCTEEGLPVEIIGDPTAGDPITSSFRGDPQASERMGFQRQATLLELLRESADADGGILYEPRDNLGIRYRTRQTLVNQTPVLDLDARSDDIAPPFDPTLDDRMIVTRATVKRPEGSSRVYDNGEPDHYEKEFELNLSWDRDLRRRAAWFVEQATWPEMRIPTVTVDLAAKPDLIDTWLDADVGDRIQIRSLPEQHPLGDVDQLMQGYSESLSPKRWTPQLNISPAGPWTAGVLDETPAAASVEAEGGTESDADGWHYHEFTSDGTLSVTRAGVAQILVVDGGGGGGGGNTNLAGGGGGAGGVQVDTSVSLSATTYNVTVGSGGTGASTVGNQGGDGNASSFDSLVVGTGGGGGGGAGANGRAGGSGGGAGGDNLTTRTGGSGTAGLGNDGGDNPSSGRGGSGGGGKNAAGVSNTGATTAGHDGGDGGSFFDGLYTVGGGGGGGAAALGTTLGSGGAGGGGNGAVGQSSIAAQNGSANTGGGGGGGSNAGSFLGGGNGGSGIVVVRYQPNDGPVEPDLALARVDTDGSSLAEDIDDSDDEFLVSVDKGPAWDTSGDYLPAGIDVGGEEMSLTAIGTFSPAEPVHGDAQFSASSSTSHVAPSVTAVGSTSVLTCFWCSRSVVGNYTVPGSMTAFAELDGSESTFRGATQQISSPGATGTRTATFSSSNQWAAASILAHGATGFPVLEDHDQATDTDEITLSVDAEAGWWLLAIHAWNTSFFTAPPGPSGGDWAEVARSSVGTTAVPVIRVFTKRVATAGLVEASFAFGDLVTDDNYAWLGAWSGIHAGTQQFTVTRGTNGIQKAHTAGTPVHVADAFRTRL